MCLFQVLQKLLKARKKQRPALQTISSIYLAKLLEVFGGKTDKVPLTGSMVRRGKPNIVLELLSRRELEVLRCIEEGLSNQEIAQRLFIAIGTVKRHVSNICEKLNVDSRTRALARAKELSFL